MHLTQQISCRKLIFFRVNGLRPGEHDAHAILRCEKHFNAVSDAIFMMFVFILYEMFIGSSVSAAHEFFVAFTFLASTGNSRNHLLMTDILCAISFESSDFH